MARLIAGLSRWHAGAQSGAAGSLVLEITATGMAPLRLALTDAHAAALAARLGGDDGAAASLAELLRAGVPATGPTDALVTLRTAGAPEPVTAGLPLERLAELAGALEFVLAGSAERHAVARHSHFQVGDRVVVRNRARGRAAGGRPGEVVRVHVAFDSAGSEPAFWYDVVLDGPRSGYPQTFLAGDLVSENDAAEDDADPGGSLP